jgi:hypothetical protein
MKEVLLSGFGIHGYKSLGVNQLFSWTIFYSFFGVDLVVIYLFCMPMFIGDQHERNNYSYP